MDIGSLFNVKGRVALVTGGSRGIGYMVAAGLLEAGAKVYICARKKPDLDAAVERLSKIGPCVGIVADLGTQDGCEGVRDAIATREDRLHIMMNNAGATWGAPLEEFPRAAFDRVLNVNVTAVFELIKLCVPLLRVAAAAGEPARVINVTSTAGLVPPESESYSYSSSKAAIIMLTRHIAKRLAPENILVNAISPGVFPTQMTASGMNADGTHRWNIPLERVGTPEDIVGTVIYLSSRASAYMTGATIRLTGGMTTAD